MSSVLVSRIDPLQLYPPFFTRLMPLLDDALRLGFAYWVVEGFRSYARSDQLYAQGRTLPGPKVTNAQAGQSAHNFGLAADLCLDGVIDRGGLQPSYKPESYEPLRELAPKHGLVWGGTFTNFDGPHLNFPGYITGDDLSNLRVCFAVGGLPECWKYIDAHQHKEFSNA